MSNFERVLALIAAIITIATFLLTYQHVLARGSFAACRRKIARKIAEMTHGGFIPELLVCLGRGGFFVGSIVTDEMDRKIPVLGIDKAYSGEQVHGGKHTTPKIELPESFTVPPVYANAKVLLVTGEIIDGSSIHIAADFVKSQIPKCEIKTFALYWYTESSFVPDYRGFEVHGRQRRLPWKKNLAPSSSDYLPSRK